MNPDFVPVTMRAFLLKDEPHPLCMRVTLDDRNVAWWLGWTRPFVIDLIFFLYFFVAEGATVHQSLMYSALLAHRVTRNGTAMVILHSGDTDLD